MLKYRINSSKFNKTSNIFKIDNVQFVDFNNLIDENDSILDYDGVNKDKFLVTCECTDIYNVKVGDFVGLTNKLFLTYEVNNEFEQNNYEFNFDFQVIGVNNGLKSFSFYLDKYFELKPVEITTGRNNENVVYIRFDDSHFFASSDYEDNSEQNIPIYFKYIDNEGNYTSTTIFFRWYTKDALLASYEAFGNEEQKKIYTAIFGSDIAQDEESNLYNYVNGYDDTDKITEEEYNSGEIDKNLYIVNNNEKYGDLSNFEIYRDTFLMGEKSEYEIYIEKPLLEIKVPITNTFETNLYQMELLKEQFVDTEKKKAINRITDIEKDIYYPCISNLEKNNFHDVYSIKFNLHFREHRNDEWIVENNSFWNGVGQLFEYVNNINESETIDADAYSQLPEEVQDNYSKTPIKGSAFIVNTIDNKPLTTDNSSDLLSFLNYTNEDVRFQKNKLKKSFLRLLFYDSMNPGNQNLIGYSTIFLNTGKLFTKFAKYFNDGEYYAVGANKKEYGEYNPSSSSKIGIRVDRESLGDFDDEKRLSSQFVVRSKDTSKSSSEGFYMYIWKDNSSPLPQDLYMKVEFNHAGYGRTTLFMMPYWDTKKWNGVEMPHKQGIKTFEEILEDWNSIPNDSLDANGRVVWVYESDGSTKRTDGHYGIRQYTKFSYIHLKYQYDKNTDKHVYYIDPDTYGNGVTIDNDEIVINLYESKIGE